jgi:hypothetical protein
MAKPPFFDRAMRWVFGKLAELAIWAGLVVAMSLLPIYLTYNDRRIGGLDVPLRDLVAGGELLLVATAIAADSLARLASQLVQRRIFKGAFQAVQLAQLVFFVASMLFAIATASEYASLVTRHALGGAVSIGYVFEQSKFFFAGTLLIGAGVILVD